MFPGTVTLQASLIKNAFEYSAHFNIQMSENIEGSLYLNKSGTVAQEICQVFQMHTMHMAIFCEHLSEVYQDIRNCWPPL